MGESKVLKFLFCTFIATGSWGITQISSLQNENIVTLNHVREVTLAEKFFDYYKSNMPVALLIVTTKHAHQDADKFFTDVEVLHLNTILLEFLLIKVNSSGTTPVLTTNVRNRVEFRQLLKWNDLQHMYPSSQIGVQNPKGSALFYAILNAAHNLPPDSGILIFTDRMPVDEDLAHLALQEVRKKRIRMDNTSFGALNLGANFGGGARIFVVWGGLSPNITEEENVLREAATYSNGAFFVSPNRRPSETYFNTHPETTEATKAQAMILLRENLKGKRYFDFPIDSGITGVHISVSSSVKSAILKLPNGQLLNILSDTDIEGFSRGSFLMNATHTKSYEIQIKVERTRSTSVYGIWYLRVTGGDVEYIVAVSVNSELQVEILRLEPHSTNKTTKKFTAKLSGDVTKISKIRLLDAEGQIYKDNVMFSETTSQNEHITDDIENIETTVTEKDVNIDTDITPDGEFYVEINGINDEGTKFRRLSYVNLNNYHFTLPPLTVEIGVGSELLVKPNQISRIFFEVTNNRDQTLFVRFRCHDDRSLLVGMHPLSTWMNPRQSVIVTVTTNTYRGSSAYNDLITFSVSGFDLVEKTALLNVNDDQIVDHYEPYLTHRYTSDCLNVLIGNCQDGSWTIEASAQDTDSGLLQLGSEPKGLYFPNGYTAGTTEKITGYYSGSCCQPKLQLIAVDRANNRKTYTADAYFATPSPGIIAAIVLGLLILILIIIALVVLCIRKCKCCRKSGSADIPIYRGPVRESSRRY